VRAALQRRRSIENGKLFVVEEYLGEVEGVSREVERVVVAWRRHIELKQHRIHIHWRGRRRRSILKTLKPGSELAQLGKKVRGRLCGRYVVQGPAEPGEYRGQVSRLHQDAVRMGVCAVPCLAHLTLKCEHWGPMPKARGTLWEEGELQPFSDQGRNLRMQVCNLGVDIKGEPLIGA
jgi:hypothetical protein